MNPHDIPDHVPGFTELPIPLDEIQEILDLIATAALHTLLPIASIDELNAVIDDIVNAVRPKFGENTNRVLMFLLANGLSVILKNSAIEIVIDDNA